MKKVYDWVEHRTGLKTLTREALYENIPGGSRWRYVWGSTLTFALVVQFITGIFLWMAYNPSSQTAWESVYYIQYEMTGGWLLRGIHHFTAQMMIVLLVLHLMQVIIDGAYKAPREINFWFGIGLLLLVMGLSLTGYLLPWDQKGYWATKVSTNLLALGRSLDPPCRRLSLVVLITATILCHDFSLCTLECCLQRLSRCWWLTSICFGAMASRQRNRSSVPTLHSGLIRCSKMPSPVWLCWPRFCSWWCCLVCRIPRPPWARNSARRRTLPRPIPLLVPNGTSFFYSSF